MLRPSLNNGYFLDLYDKAEEFGIEVEAHRMYPSPSLPMYPPLYSTTLTPRPNPSRSPK